MPRHEPEPRVVLGMSEHHDGGVSTRAAFIETRAYQLTADSQALMFGAHGHRRQAGDADIDRRLESHGREENVADDLFIDRGNKGQVVVGTSQRVDQTGFERRAERQLVRLADAAARMLTGCSTTSRKSPMTYRGFGPMNATGVAASRIATTTTNASGPIGHSSRQQQHASATDASVRHSPMTTPAR